jgi:hypothetical protein
MRIALVGLALVVAGCSSTGVVQADHDTYMISKKSAAGIFGSPEGVKGDIYAEGRAFCEKRGEVLQTVTADTKGPIPFYRMGSAHLLFKCVPRPAPPSS